MAKFNIKMIEIYVKVKFNARNFPIFQQENGDNQNFKIAIVNLQFFYTVIEFNCFPLNPILFSIFQQKFQSFHFVLHFFVMRKK